MQFVRVRLAWLLCSALWLPAMLPAESLIARPDLFRELDGHLTEIDFLRFIKNDRWLISFSSKDRVLAIRDGRTGKIKHRVQHRGLTRIAISPDQRLVASIPETPPMLNVRPENRVRIWEIDSGRLVSDKKLPEEFSSYGLSLAFFGPDEKTIAFEYDDTLFFFDLERGTVTDRFFGLGLGYKFQIRMVPGSTDRFLVLPESGSKKLLMRSLADEKFSREIVSEHEIKDFSVMNGKLVLILSNGLEVRKLTGEKLGHKSGGAIRLFARNESDFAIWTYRKLEILFAKKERPTVSVQLRRMMFRAEALALDSRGKKIAVGYEKGQLHLIEIDRLADIDRRQLSDIEKFWAFSPFSKTVQSGGYTGLICVPRCLCKSETCQAGKPATFRPYENESLTGVFVGGLLEGPGVLEKYGSTWKGNFQAGLPEGPGVLQTQLGRLEGNWVGGSLHGAYTITLKDGRKTRGEYRLGHPWQGFGIGDYRDKEFQGEWRDGRPHGRGVLRDRMSMMILFQGKFQNGVPIK